MNKTFSFTFDYVNLFNTNPFSTWKCPVYIDGHWLWYKEFKVMSSPDIIVSILLIADQYNGTYTKAQTVNYIADYEVPVLVRCSSLANLFCRTKIFCMCQVHAMVYCYYVKLL